MEDGALEAGARSRVGRGAGAGSRVGDGDHGEGDEDGGGDHADEDAAEPKDMLSYRRHVEH